MLLAALALTLAPSATPLQDGGPPILPPRGSRRPVPEALSRGYPVFEPVTFVTLADEPRDVLKDAPRSRSS